MIAGRGGAVPVYVVVAVDGGLQNSVSTASATGGEVRGGERELRRTPRELSSSRENSNKKQHSKLQGVAVRATLAA